MLYISGKFLDFLDSLCIVWILFEVSTQFLKNHVHFLDCMDSLYIILKVSELSGQYIYITGVCVGIYYEGIYMVKVILAEIRHFECPNEKVEENRLVTKSSILSMESLGWPNTQIQIHKYTNMCI